MNQIARLAAPIVPLLLVTGCGGRIADAPSLLPRAIEKTADVDAPIAPPVPVAADPALPPRLAAILAAGKTAHDAFEQERGKAAGAIARSAGTAPGSDSWIAAQTALSAMQAARGGVQAAAADLDTLRRDQAGAGPDDQAAMDAAASRLDAMAAEEATATATLSARLDR